jgi:NAD(P)-dependent dehydrogenase (short-subunit alcohol dehydrogenase family)
MSKVILVTGANTGIGFELVRLLAEKKHTVYIGARNETAGKEAQAKLHTDGLTTVKYVRIDVTDIASIQAAKETIDKEEGKLDVLVNNAGIAKMGENQNATSLSLTPVREALETNFFGLIQTTITFLPLLRKPTHAVILNVSTDMASNTFQARPNASLHFVAYNASKAAANSYTIALAQELKGEGIKVNAVTPGFTTTKLNHYSEGGKSVRDGAAILLPWALLEKDGPTCLFINEHGKEHPW